MDQPAIPAEDLKIEQLLHLHTLTKDVAKLCQKQLRGYLDTLALLFRPRRILGDAMEGAERESVGGSDRTVAELRDLYRKVAVRPFGLRPELSLPLESVSTQMHLYEWEYLHQTSTDRGWRSIKVTSPLTWVLTYSSNYSLPMLRQVLAGQDERDSEAVRAFVLRACIAHPHFQKFPAITDLLAGLRYRVEVRQSPETDPGPRVRVPPPGVRPAVARSGETMRHNGPARTRMGAGASPPHPPRRTAAGLPEKRRRTRSFCSRNRIGAHRRTEGRRLLSRRGATP